ncbi:MAG: hypothetical protein K9H48_19385 [Melioribacteraceae bacterium]|nr:hypothetical protein [Saprospiraceae bacterium]MCF8356612.1 hypothetical protein [Melioribacteraceae bacterium]MCF8395996.1 hypothetical protein [Melioribacteraceae bacterium]
MKTILRLFLLLAVNTVVFSNISAQSFGFGCLGLSGVYAGYSINQYHPDGLNQYLNDFYNQIDSEITNLKFEKREGIRVGANIFRAKFGDFFLSTKGFYQFNSEEKDVSFILLNNSRKDSYKLDTDYWGVGLDFGVPIFKFLDWKIVEGGVTFNSVELTKTLFENGEKISDTVYESDGSKVGYYAATGVVIHLIPDYISIEATAAYHMFSLENIQNSDLLMIPGDAITQKLIEKGGFGATVQLNIGVPL